MDTDHGVSDAHDPPGFDQAPDYHADKVQNVDLDGQTRSGWQYELPRFEVFFAQHHDFVWRNLRRLGVHDSTIDDATQEVFVRLHRNWDGFRGDAPARVWVFGYVRRVAAHYRRTEFRRRRKHDAWRQRFEQSNGLRSELGQGPDSIYAAMFLHRLLAALSAQERELFVASELEGLTGPELAELSNCKLATVYSRIRALRSHVERIRSELETEANDQPSAHHMKMPALALLALVYEVPGGGAQRNWLALQATLQTSFPVAPTAVAPLAAGWLTHTGGKFAALGLASLTFGGAGLLLAEGMERPQIAVQKIGGSSTRHDHTRNEHALEKTKIPPPAAIPSTADSDTEPDHAAKSSNPAKAKPSPRKHPTIPAAKQRTRPRPKTDRDAGLRTEERLLQSALEAFAAGDFIRCVRLLDLADSLAQPGVFTHERKRLRGRAQRELSD